MLHACCRRGGLERQLRGRRERRQQQAERGQVQGGTLKGWVGDEHYSIVSSKFILSLLNKEALFIVSTRGKSQFLEGNHFVFKIGRAS